MGDVVVKFKVVPEGLEVKIDKLKQACEKVVLKYGRLVGTSTEPLAFGMNAVVITAVMKELPDGMEPVENELAGVKGVSRAEAVDVRRMM